MKHSSFSVDVLEWNSSSDFLLREKLSNLNKFIILFLSHSNS